MWNSLKKKGSIDYKKLKFEIDYGDVSENILIIL